MLSHVNSVVYRVSRSPVGCIVSYCSCVVSHGSNAVSYGSCVVSHVSNAVGYGSCVVTRVSCVVSHVICVVICQPCCESCQLRSNLSAVW